MLGGFLYNKNNNNNNNNNNSNNNNNDDDDDDIDDNNNNKKCYLTGKKLYCVFYTKKEPAALVSGWTFTCAYLADIPHAYPTQAFVLDSDWFI